MEPKITKTLHQMDVGDKFLLEGLAWVSTDAGFVLLEGPNAGYISNIDDTESWTEQQAEMRNFALNDFSDFGSTEFELIDLV